MIRARINHGKRGKSIDTLLKKYEFQHPCDYYAYIIDSYVYGNYDQVIELFNEMKGIQQKSLLLNVQSWHPVYGNKVHDFIIKYL